MYDFIKMNSTLDLSKYHPDDTRNRNSCVREKGMTIYPVNYYDTMEILKRGNGAVIAMI